MVLSKRYLVPVIAAFGILTFGSQVAASEETEETSRQVISHEEAVIQLGERESEPSVSHRKAVASVEKMFENLDNAEVDLERMVGDDYLIRVYEMMNQHTATFGWYIVDSETGEVEQFM
ncbi:hypothetical protein LCM20_01850 [Halobacillus litoralis]|uniref:hypothetical protein n=1 Tax=Halobacillus litoralis TaxID=45668 RepID=UPI001CD711D9|nr:hypothetical protein [Halobacillus litoralis]MCA0969331.1 hypothetical protein [Halobacillus litoralis]